MFMIKRRLDRKEKDFIILESRLLGTLSS